MLLALVRACSGFNSRLREEATILSGWRELSSEFQLTPP